MTTFVRLHECTECAAESVAAVRNALGAADIEIAGTQCLEAAAMGILLFDTVDGRVIDVVQSLSRGGHSRILALQLRGDHEDLEGYWRLLHAGAADVVAWSDDAVSVRSIADRLRRWQEIDAILESGVVRNNLAGSSPAWRHVLCEIVETARFTDLAMLITGESGTGKELVARLIHTLDPRPDKGELVVLDCTTIVPELSGSELFGHERGAFTGATASRDGAFALANGGTLFLDEAGELPPALQAQLLRVIQERIYKRVGGNQWLRTNFRLICATNRNLQAEIGSGNFRGDLFYRIASWSCELPPLRERIDDILHLARHFLAGPDGSGPQLTAAVREYLLRRQWPGNVRELRQLVLRIQARHVGAGPITLGDLPREEWLTTQPQAQDWRNGDFERAIQQAVCMGVGLRELSQHATETAVRMVVREEGGNLQRAARRLGVTDRALQMRRAQQPSRRRIDGRNLHDA